MTSMTRRALCALALGLWFGAASAAAPLAANERIIVSGASGQLGGLVVKELLARGVPAQSLILVSHTPDKLSEYAKLGASVRFGDVNKPESLPDAYAGGTRMLMISVGLGEKTPRPELHKRAFDAAVKAGVKRIVYTSFLGVDTSTSPLALDHRASEASLRASGAQWIALRNGIYADFEVLRSAQQMVVSGKANAPANEVPSAPIAREDCAAAAAAALLSAGSESRAYDITGPELVTTADIARVAGELTGRKIEVATAPAPAQGGAAGIGMATLSAGQVAANARVFKTLTGREPMGLRAYLQAHKAELLKQ